MNSTPRNPHIEFNNAKRSALLCLSDPAQYSLSYFQIALERMFNALLAMTPPLLESGPACDLAVQTQVRAYAVRVGEGQYVMFINDEPVRDLLHPPTASEFIREMLDQGWEMLEDKPTEDDLPFYELQFARKSSSLLALDA